MTLARSAQDQELLVEFVARALARIDAGQPVDPQSLCAEHPHLVSTLAEILGLQAELPSLQQAALRQDPLAGALLGGRYLLQSCLGRGAMGVVYRALDQELQRQVAVKILDVRLFRDPDAEQRFRREAEALAMLQDPHVVAVFDRGRTPEGIHYLVMELLDGATLATLLEQMDGNGGDALATAARLFGELPPDTTWPRLCARWARDLARGLGAAHARGLVHRDVKPSNAFVARSHRPVLLDFGIAARAADRRLTATQTTLGTPWYMPPEQVRSGGGVDARPTLDVYGLGATLYHLLTGRPPYDGDAPTVLAALPHRDPSPILGLQPDLPRDLAAIVERCLEREPTRRYPDAGALAADLDAFLQHQPVAARPIRALGRRLRRWRRAPAQPLAVLAALVAILLGWFGWRAVAREEEAERQQQLRSLYATLPSVLAVEGWPEERLLLPLQSEHRQGIELLHQLLALDPKDLPARLLRACLRQDLGDGAGAAADFAELAAQTDSDYLRQLAARYATAPAAVAGAAAIDLAGLPSPSTPQDHYVAGYHELRQSNRPGFAARADAWFARAVADYPPARDGRLLSLAALAERQKGEEQAETLRRLYDETIALEQLYGGPTARTCAMRGVALLLRQDYAAAVPEFEQSLRLRPQRHGPLQNLGICWFRLVDYDRAIDYLQQALAVRPFAWNTRFTLAQVHRDRGDHATALALAEGLAKTGQREESWKQPDLVGSILQAQAMALREREPATSRQLAARALAAYDEAIAQRSHPEALQRRELVAALQLERPQDHLLPFAWTMVESPNNHYQLANLAFLLPVEGLGKTETALLAAILRRLAYLRAPGDAAFRERMLAEIEAGLRPYR